MVFANKTVASRENQHFLAHDQNSSGSKTHNFWINLNAFSNLICSALTNFVVCSLATLYNALGLCA